MTTRLRRPRLVIGHRICDLLASSLTRMRMSNLYVPLHASSPSPSRLDGVGDIDPQTSSSSAKLLAIKIKPFRIGYYHFVISNLSCAKFGNKSWIMFRSHHWYTGWFIFIISGKFAVIHLHMTCFSWIYNVTHKVLIKWNFFCWDSFWVLLEKWCQVTFIWPITWFFSTVKFDILNKFRKASISRNIFKREAFFVSSFSTRIPTFTIYQLTKVWHLSVLQI